VEDGDQRNSNLPGFENAGEAPFLYHMAGNFQGTSI